MAARRKPRSRAPHTKAVAYLRVSTDGQELGLDAQRDAIARDAARRGVQVAAWCADDGVSGSVPAIARPGFQRALAAIGEHGATLLLVAKPDRLSRGSLGEAELAEHAVIRLGAVLGYADGTPETSTAQAELQRDMFRVFAKYERKLIAERTSAALQAKRARGERAGQVPVGYRLGHDGQTLLADPAEQSALAAARGWRREGLSFRAITARLGAEHPRPDGRRWHLTTVQRLLADEP